MRYYDAYNAGDLATIAELLDPEVEYHDMIYEEPFRWGGAGVGHARAFGAPALEHWLTLPLGLAPYQHLSLARRPQPDDVIR